MRHTCDHGVNWGVHACDCEEFNRDHTGNQYDLLIMGYLPQVLSEYQRVPVRIK